MFFLLLTKLLIASSFATPELQVGDILLQPLSCRLCSLIEAEEDTIYSHMGLVVSTQPPLVVEAYGKVRLIALNEFQSKTEAKQKIAVIRFQNSELVKKFELEQISLRTMFNNDFSGLSYDSDFLWNNFNDQGEEKLYCSELVTKLIQGFAGIEIPVKKMHFETNREAWLEYFRGNPPDGQWGNSPADFLKSELFYTVGEIN